MSKSEIRVNTSPVANQYGNEKIIEFSSPVGGGLISFTVMPDDQLSVHVYRQDLTVQVSAGEPGQPVRYGNLRLDRALYEAAKAFVTGYETRQRDGDAASTGVTGSDEGGKTALPVTLAARAREALSVWDAAHHEPSDDAELSAADLLSEIVREVARL